MDATLMGVIIGSVLSFSGSFFGHWSSMRKEEKQWNRQQQAEEAKRIREAELARKQSKFNAYHKCINALSLLISMEFSEEKLKVTDDERLELYRNAYDWLTLVSLQNRDYISTKSKNNFRSELRFFTESADKFTARSLYNLVIERAINDKDLYPDAPIKVEDPGESEISIEINDDFRRDQFLEGVEIPKSYTFRISFNELTREQRRKFLDMYFDTNKLVPRRYSRLPIPKFNKEKQKLVLRGGTWSARLNPLTNDPKNIIRAWELDFENALEEAQTESEAHSVPQ